MGPVGVVGRRVVDGRAAAVVGVADPPVVALWRDLGEVTGGPAPGMGLAAGERPGADVEVLASLVAAAEYELARRLVLAGAAGALPLAGAAGAVLRARGWSAGSARRLVTAGRLAVGFPVVAEQWAAGVITAEHVAAIERCRGLLSDEQLAVALRGFAGRWGLLSPRAVGEVIAAIEARVHPPADPSPDERAAYEARHLVFAVTAHEVLISGSLPRVEGEAFLAVIEAYAEAARSAADHVPAAARRADALSTLVQAAANSGTLPSRGGLPVALTVTLTPTLTPTHPTSGTPTGDAGPPGCGPAVAGDVLAVTSRGHQLTPAEVRWACCDPTLTPVLVEDRTAARTRGRSTPGLAVGPGPDPGQARILAIAEALLGQQVPLAVGRTSRTATPAQRRALAVRDRGCIIPGCGVPAELCQVHHLHDWAAGGPTDLDNEALLCWTHHRQVDLNMWTITAQPPAATPPPEPPPGAPAGTPWPGNNGSPWTITRQPRTRWNL